VVGEFAAATMFTHSANHASFGSARITDLSMVAIAYFGILITQDSAAPATLLWTVWGLMKYMTLYHTILQYAKESMDISLLCK